jgi:hypothetical protein
MPNDQNRSEMLAVLREIRDDQRAMLEQVAAQRALVEEQVRRSRESIAESISLQKVALERQRAITLFAMVGIVGCIAAILYLVIRYL